MKKKRLDKKIEKDDDVTRFLYILKNLDSIVRDETFIEWIFFSGSRTTYLALCTGEGAGSL